MARQRTSIFHWRKAAERELNPLRRSAWRGRSGDLVDRPVDLAHHRGIARRTRHRRFRKLDQRDDAEGRGEPFQAKRRHFPRSEEHTSELQSLMRISYAVFCLKTKTHYQITIS